MSDRYDTDAFGGFQPKRPPRSSRKKFTGTTDVVLQIISVIGGVVSGPLFVMIGTTYLHARYPAVPALGFFPSFISCIVVQSLFGTFPKGDKS